MPTSETLTEKIAVSIVCLRKGRTELARMPPTHDSSALRVRIDICDELISGVGEIDQNLRRLSFIRLAHKQMAAPISGAKSGVHRDDGCSSATNS
jgi:hypothetical protein